MQKPYDLQRYDQNRCRNNAPPTSSLTTAFKINVSSAITIRDTGPCCNNAFKEANIRTQGHSIAFFFFFFANARPPSALAKCITENDASRIKPRIYNRYLSFTTHLMSRGRRTYLLLSILRTQSRFQPSRYVKSLLPSPLSVPSPFHGRNERHYPRKFRSLADKNEQNV